MTRITNDEEKFVTGFSLNNSLSNNIHTISFEYLSRYFCLPITQAAKELKTCVTVLKKISRKFHINKWPYRKIKEINSLKEKKQNGNLQGKLNYLTIEKIQEIEKKILENPNLFTKDLIEQALSQTNEFNLTLAPLNLISKRSVSSPCDVLNIISLEYKNADYFISASDALANQTLLYSLKQTEASISKKNSIKKFKDYTNLQKSKFTL